MIVNHHLHSKQIRVVYSGHAAGDFNFPCTYYMDVPFERIEDSDSTPDISVRSYVPDSQLWLRYGFTDESNPYSAGSGKRKGLLFHAKFGSPWTIDEYTRQKITHNYPGFSSDAELDFQNFLDYWYPSYDTKTKVFETSTDSIQIAVPYASSTIGYPIIWQSPVGKVYSVLQPTPAGRLYLGVNHYLDPVFVTRAKDTTVFVKGFRYSFGNSGPVQEFDLHDGTIEVTLLSLWHAFESALQYYPEKVYNTWSLPRNGTRNGIIQSYFVHAVTKESATTMVRRFNYQLSAFTSTYTRIISRPNAASTPVSMSSFPRYGDFEYDMAIQSALYGSFEGSKTWPGIEYTTSNSWQNVLAAIGVAYSWMISGKIDLPEEWKSTWLQYRYVGSTGISDLQAYCGYVQKRVERFYNPWILHRGFAEFNGFPIAVSYASRDRVLAGWKNLSKAAQAWGFYPSWYQLWDFVPYSFIVDWALPIGPQLEHMQKAQYYTERNFEFSYGYWITSKGTLSIEGTPITFFFRDFCTDYTIDDYAWQDEYSPSTRVKIKRSIDTIALREALKHSLSPTQLVQEVKAIGESFSRYGY